MNIAFIGGGNMAAALIGGMQRGGAAHAISVLEIAADRRAHLARQYGVTVHATAGAWLRDSEVVVLAVKPQQMRAVAAAIRPFLARPLLLSIAAGVRAGSLARWLGTDVIVRTMPNTPAMIGAGITGAAALASLGADDVKAAIVRALHAANARARELGDELDA